MMPGDFIRGVAVETPVTRRPPLQLQECSRRSTPVNRFCVSPSTGSFASFLFARADTETNGFDISD